MKAFNNVILQKIVVIFLLGLASSALWAGQLNVRDADIRALIAQISDITGKSFVVDPRVKGKVTVISNQDMSYKEIYEVFLSVLHVHGYAAVRAGEVVKIVPNTGAKQDSLRVDQNGDIKGEELITRVIEVKNSPATELVPILRPMVPQYGHVAAVPSANALIITDHAKNITRILKIIEQLDNAESEEVEVVQLQEAWVGDVVGLLERLAPVNTGSGSSSASRKAKTRSRVIVVADERTNRLILKGEKSARSRIRELVKDLDTPTNKSGSTQVIYLNHADAANVAEIIKGLIAPVAPTRGKKDAPVAQSTIQADEALNALVVRAEPSQLSEIYSIVKQLDVRRAQVLIEGAIVEVVGNAGQAVGFQWGFGDGENGPVGGVSFSNAGNSLTNIIAAATNPVGAAALQLADGITLGGATRGNDGNVQFGVLLQALSTMANTNILSTPSIMTMDNEEAEIIVGQNVPFITGSSTSGGSGVSNPFTTVSREDIGLTLRVTPHISDGNTVRLEIYQESSALVANAEGIQTADVTTAKRSIKTTVLVDNNQTIVLGGLVEDDIIESTRKVPLLGDIPWIGRLFRGTTQSHTKRNLMVFLRPTILRDTKNVTALSHRKYAGVKAFQLELGESNGDVRVSVEAVLPEQVESLFDAATMTATEGK